MLVHGAYHGAWCWKDVAGSLRDHCHTVYTPTLTGLGERSHLLSARSTLDAFIEDVAQVFKYEDFDDIILVGHSFAGSVLLATADRMPERLRHLVYLDSLIPTRESRPPIALPNALKSIVRNSWPPTAVSAFHRQVRRMMALRIRTRCDGMS